MPDKSNNKRSKNVGAKKTSNIKNANKKVDNVIIYSLYLQKELEFK